MTNKNLVIFFLINNASGEVDIKEEIFIEDDIDTIEYFEQMYDFTFSKKFRLKWKTMLHVLNWRWLTII